ncbi:MATE family efflux transporter [Paenibacillus hexagrammi]|uniref:MATE family efflux transporter n=1 Tax=Paenibacillus hexagrammi TaxID=2908839 RepID=A0ABY3SC07_9BACL|nr:MATE family efflux transporter [Paenibacillus sp. YPD9-1]UJF31478.1 MATE family efflux transporter [Paenibacillus sp. YPD9-1]
MEANCINANKSLYIMAWPILLELLFFRLMGTVDTLMLSRYADNAAAAVGFSNQILLMVTVMFNSVAIGAGTLISQFIGRNDKDKIGEVTVSMLVINAAFGLFVSVLLIAFSNSLLAGLQLPQGLREDADSYLSIVGGAALLQALLIAASCVVRSMGFTRYSMYVNVGINVFHAIVNAFLIYGLWFFPELGVEGSAISTVISRGLGLVALLFLVGKLQGGLAWRAIFRYKRTIYKVMKLGSTVAGESLSIYISQMVITVFIAMLGAEALSAKVYVQNLTTFISLFASASGQALQIMVGHLVGQSDSRAAYRTALTGFRNAALVSASVSLAVWLFGKSILGMYTDDSGLVSLCRAMLVITVLMEVGRAFNLTVSSSLRGAGDIRYTSLICIFFVWFVSVPLSYMLGIHWGYGILGIWAALALDEWLRGLLMLRRWKARKWETKSLAA